MVQEVYMCLAKVYQSKAGAAPIMEEVARIRFQGERLEIENLFGQERIIKGRVMEVDFTDSRVIVDVAAAQAEG